MEDMAILQDMIDRAKPHNLEMECLLSLINNLVGVTSKELEDEYEQALCEWDI